MARKKSASQQRYEALAAQLVELNAANGGWRGGGSHWYRDDGVEVQRGVSHDAGEEVWRGRKSDAGTWGGDFGSSGESAMKFADTVWPRVPPATP
jgi:hypothetical protein